MDLIRNFSILILVACGLQAVAADRVLSIEAVRPLVRVIDLNVGESTTLKLCNGQSVEVTLLDLNETRDPRLLITRFSSREITSSVCSAVATTV
jgi:hypothetical protein